MSNENPLAEMPQMGRSERPGTRQALRWPADTVPAFVVDRGCYGLEFFEKVTGDPTFHLIIWQKGFTVRNLFHQAPQPFKKAYDNYRDDHEPISIGNCSAPFRLNSKQRAAKGSNHTFARLFALRRRPAGSRANRQGRMPALHPAGDRVE